MRNTTHKLFHDYRLRYLHDDCNISGAVKNHFIALCKRYYRRYHKGISYKKMSAHLTKLKKLPKYKHWNIPYAWSLQNVLKRLSQAFREVKTLGRGVPQLKACKKHKGMDLYRYTSPRKSSIRETEKRKKSPYISHSPEWAMV